jgi:hypothetical protein
MQFLNKNVNNGVDLRIDYRYYTDMYLSNRLVDCDVDIKDPIACIVFSEDSVGEGISSEYCWSGATSEFLFIKDYGITGYDNRRVLSLTDDLNIDYECFTIFPVSGDNYCYDIIEDDGFMLFNGGFYQNFYGLDGQNHQLLPNFFEDGWTATFSIMKTSGVTSGCTLPLLNDEYPNNSGFFYYVGTRAENKFCSLKEHLLNYKVSSGVTFLDSVLKENDRIVPTGNPFLFYTRENVCNYEFSGATVELPDCCDGLMNNAIGFRITEEGSIGYRILSSSGECIEDKYSEEFFLKENYTPPNTIINNELHQIHIRFINDSKLECPPNSLTYGTLYVYVDGYLKLKDYVPNIIPYAFDDLSSKQYGVPYNISIGGGTQGLLEMQRDEPKELVLCNYEFLFKPDSIFKGIILNDIVYSSSITYSQLPLLENFLKEVIVNIYGDIYYEMSECNGSKFYIKYSEDIIGGFLFEKQNIPFTILPSNTKCTTIQTDNKTCGILEENFAGTFIGYIYDFCLYDYPMTIQQIKNTLL